MSDGMADAKPKAPNPKAPPEPTLPPRRSWIAFAVILVINYLIVRSLLPGPVVPLPIPYTIFTEQVSNGNVASIYSRGASIEGRLKKAITWPPEGKSNEGPPKEGAIKMPQPAPRSADTFITELPAFVDPGLEKFLIEH